MKNYKLLFTLAVVLIVGACAQPEKMYDQKAIDDLDSLSFTIGELSSCSYTLEVRRRNMENEEIHTMNDVYLRGPNKMYVYSDGTKGKIGYYYNGTSLAFYSYDKNTYDTVSAPETIISAVDFLHHKYGIDFPASDFFYPTLTDDIIAYYSSVESLTCEEKLTGILAKNDKELVEIWIDETTYLPYSIQIQSLEDSANYYQAYFSNWRLNPKLPDMLFELHIPKDAERIVLPTKN